MQLRDSTSAMLDALHAFSGGKLTRRTDLGLLIECAHHNGRQSLLDELSFIAKFTSRTYRILQRIGKETEGYDKLSDEFSEGMDKATSLVRTIVAIAPPEVQQPFAVSYLSMTPDSIQNLLALFYDLSWYKNWQIDHPGESLNSQ